MIDLQTLNELNGAIQALHNAQHHICLHYLKYAQRRLITFLPHPPRNRPITPTEPPLTYDDARALTAHWLNEAHLQHQLQRPLHAYRASQFASASLGALLELARATPWPERATFDAPATPLEPTL